MTNKANASTGTSAAGLRDVAAAKSSISDVNGEKGELIYQGYNIHDLAQHATFEEVVFLLWNKRLPTSAELGELEQALRASYEVAGELVDLMKQFPKEADPIDVLRTAVSALEFYDPNARDTSPEVSIKTAIRLTAQFPTIVALGDRLRRGLDQSLRSRLGSLRISVHAKGREAFRAPRAHIRRGSDTPCRS